MLQAADPRYFPVGEFCLILIGLQTVRLDNTFVFLEILEDYLLTARAVIIEEIAQSARYDHSDVSLLASASFILQWVKECVISLVAAEVLFHGLSHGLVTLLEETDRLCEKTVYRGLVYFEAVLLGHRGYLFLR